MRLYAITIFVAAFLLFEVEPMLAKYILPWFGGTAAVWTTCLLFFQTSLLAGYTYSHLLATRMAPQRQVTIHLVLIGAGILLMGMLALSWNSPIMPGPNWKPLQSDSPVLHILCVLSASIGLPYFILSATGPLLQAWLTQTHPGISPYRLYSLSNLGSLLALLSYPFVVEPRLSLRMQGDAWCALYLAFALGMGLCARSLVNSRREGLEAVNPAASINRAPRRRQAKRRRPARSGPTRRSPASRESDHPYMLWVSLSACASLLLYAATTEMTRDVAPIPFLWVLPLALYLISFIICFDNERWYERGIFHPALALAISLALVVHADPLKTGGSLLVVQLGIPCFLLFVVCMVCHGEVARLKPDDRGLTAFYLMVSTGGVLGGVFAVAIAPVVFADYWEYSIAIWLCPVLLFLVLMRDPESWLRQSNPAIPPLLLGATLALPELNGYYPFTSTWLYNLFALAFVGLMVLPAFWRSAALLARPGVLTRFSVITAILVVGVIFISNPTFEAALATTRNFYGVLRVLPSDQQPAGSFYQLSNGDVIHGAQFFAPGWRYRPIAYYGEDSGVGLVISHYPRGDGLETSPLRVGAIGLGVGTISAWGKPGDHIRFYEVNPAIIKLATDPRGYFTYVHDSRANVEIIPGDARLSMERELRDGPAQKFDILVLDAFSGDTIPVHLLTMEAMQIYLRELKPDGVIAIHISNAYIDLRPVIAELSRAFNLRRGEVLEDPPESSPYLSNDWVLLARNDHVLVEPEIATRLEPPGSVRTVRIWTDDYSNLFQVLK
jgi:hypothetical protein